MADGRFLPLLDEPPTRAGAVGYPVFSPSDLQPRWTWVTLDRQALWYPASGKSTSLEVKLDGRTWRRRFIAARLDDNPHLAGTGYREQLLQLPDEISGHCWVAGGTRRRWRCDIRGSAGQSS